MSVDEFIYRQTLSATTMVRTLQTFLSVLLLSATTTAPGAPAVAPEPLILAVHPYLPPAEIITRFTPLAEYLARAVGRPVAVRVGPNTGQHIEAVGRNAVDIAYIGPYAYVRMVSAHGKKPLLARVAFKGKLSLSSYIVTRTDSPFQTLSDLRGKRFAFGDPDAIMSTLMPRYALLKAGVHLDALGMYRYIGSQANIALGVLNDDFDAGAVREEFFDEFGARGLRILARLPEVPVHLFVTRSDMPVAQVKVLREALLQLQNAPDGAAILRAIGQDMTAMLPVTDADYDGMRKVLRAIDDERG